MKYKYVGALPTVCVVEGSLIQVNKGDIVNLTKPVSSEFVVVSYDAPHRRVTTTTPKVTQPKKEVTTNATRTETSRVGK